MGLETIDHRAWSPRGINTTLVNEVYARAELSLEGKSPQEALDELITGVTIGMEETINQPETSKVKVQRWFPGVIEEIVEEVNEKRRSNVTQRLLSEASSMLERKQQMQLAATKEKSISELMGQSPTLDVEKGVAHMQNGKIAAEGPILSSPGMPLPSALDAKPRRRVRQKMRSTPVVGGGLFGEHIEAKSGREGPSKIAHYTSNTKSDDLNSWSSNANNRGVSAELTIKGESYNIRISQDTWTRLQKGLSGQMVDSRGIEIAAVNISASNADAPVVQRLQGFVRNMPLSQIREETVDGSEVQSVDNSVHQDH